jgi:hypothetical protein
MILFLFAALIKERLLDIVKLPDSVKPESLLLLLTTTNLVAYSNDVNDERIEL